MGGGTGLQQRKSFHVLLCLLEPGHQKSTKKDDGTTVLKGKQSCSFIFRVMRAGGFSDTDGKCGKADESKW